MITEPEYTKQYKKKMFKITELYRIDVQYYNADLSAQVRLMNDQCTRFIFSPELRKLFEKEMNQAINKLKNENL